MFKRRIFLVKSFPSCFRASYSFINGRKHVLQTVLHNEGPHLNNLWIFSALMQLSSSTPLPFSQNWPRMDRGAFSSVVSRLFVTPRTAACQSITNTWSLLTLMSIESVIPSNHLTLCHPLLLLPLIFPSIRVFSNEPVLHIRWPKYWSFSFSISSFNEYSGLISFRMDWFNLLAIQGTQKSSPTPQFKSIN